MYQERYGMTGSGSIKYFLLGLSILTATPALAISGLTEELDYHCKQAAERLSCDYRFTSPQQRASVTARIGDVRFTPVTEDYPAATDKTAILFLIDTSDPRRVKAIARNIEHVDGLLNALEAYHLPGLATFDSDLNIRLLPGASKEAIREVLETQVEAIGKTTELYRNTLQAVKVLSDTRASRKLIILLSDGLAEDQAYHHGDVVAAALKAGVVINTIGYAQSVSQSVSLQTLRRLSEETGGEFTAAGLPNYSLPENFFESPFEIIDNGGKFSVDLGKADDQGLYDTQDLEVAFNTPALSAKINLPVTLSPAPKPEQEALPSVEVDPIKLMQDMPVQDLQTPTAAPQVLVAPAPAPANPWIWYGIPLSFLLVVIIALLYFGKLFRRKPAETAANKTSTAPYAYLVRNDGTDERFAIDMNPWRVGRSKSNEMTLHDESISRQHAELHRDADGKVMIKDLDSLNGVYVNDRKISTSELQEGDIVELGDVSFKYSLQDEDYEAQMPTVVIKTSMP